MKRIKNKKRPIVYIIGQHSIKTWHRVDKDNINKNFLSYKLIERGPIKIGFTDRPQYRLAELQTGNPRLLDFVAQLDVLDSVIGKAIETELHSILKGSKSIIRSKKDRLGFYQGSNTEWFNISCKLGITFLSSFPYIKESIVKKIPNDYHSKLPASRKYIDIIDRIWEREMDRASDSKFNTVTFDDLTPGELLADIYNDSYAEIVKKDFRFRNFTAIEPYK